MTESIDRRIADIERELAGMRRQKLAELETQMEALRASMGGAEAPAPAAKRRGRPPKAGWADAASAKGAKEPKRRGRKRGKQLSDEEALAALTKTVKAAGGDGVSARAASQSSGVFYPRAIKLMDQNFTKTGSGKWTRYTA